jgi:hypothetical protein
MRAPASRLFLFPEGEDSLVADLKIVGIPSHSFHCEKGHDISRPPDYKPALSIRAPLALLKMEAKLI